MQKFLCVTYGMVAYKLLVYNLGAGAICLGGSLYFMQIHWPIASAVLVLNRNVVCVCALVVCLLKNFPS